MTRLADLQRVSVDDSGKVFVDGEEPNFRTTHNGYLQFWAGQTSLRVNRVVAQALHGEPCDARRFPRIVQLLGSGQRWVVAHKNRDPKDNRPENLMWCPTSFNAKHSIPCPVVARVAKVVRMRRRRLVRGSDCPAVRAIRGMLAWRKSARLWDATKRERQREVTAHWLPHPAGEDHPACKLSTEQVQAIRVRAAGGESMRSLGREYGVSNVHIGRIMRGTKRRHDATGH